MQLPKLPTAPGQELKFATPLGRAVYNAVFNEKPSDVSQSFLARRLAFVYELDEDTGTDVPTTLRRSLADCPPVRAAHALSLRAHCCQCRMLVRPSFLPAAPTVQSICSGLAAIAPLTARPLFSAF